MREINAYLLLLGSMLLNFSLAIAQTTINHENIFSLRHTCVGIPEDDKLRIYALKKRNWQLMDSIPLPKDYKALDGNIRRVYILMENQMVFHGFYGEPKDTLLFSDSIKMNGITHWIRTPHSTEKDIWIYENERIAAYVKDGEKWLKIDMYEHLSRMLNNEGVKPLIKENVTRPFKKLYSFENEAGEHTVAVHDDKMIFYRYELPAVYREARNIDFEEKYGHSLPSPKEMEFVLQDGAITAFVYDRRMVAVVFPGLIRFYRYDFGRKKWTQIPDVPDLAYGACCMYPGGQSKAH
ncbi:hypothetical protein JHJ32_12555 [Parapedobacter sp. ISTM3]|uniref:hypothetical protein n=1 Tax=Parapedobacter sp. ISTM3 TaxID=2800130 RepID=UPI0019069567|nr:hypothetical protein [Parapedobacter sp. ISTM3]MBK1440822.1 hypothetical protein [Parapedobacter sp. ISTM3]